MTDPIAPKRKRSRHATVLLAGAALLTLAACQDERVDAEAFPDLQSCLAAAKDNSLWFTEDDCRQNFAAAEQEYIETAPRYDSLAVCEEQHGVGNCGSDPVAQQGGGGGFGGIFLPLFMGYMMGQMMSRGGISSQPMVPNAQGGYSTPKGDQSFASNRGAGKVAPATFNRAPTTMGQPPMTPAQVSQRGGFGGSLTSAASRSSSGG